MTFLPVSSKRIIFSKTRVLLPSVVRSEFFQVVAMTSPYDSAKEKADVFIKAPTLPTGQNFVIIPLL